ncbi:MAG TPA: hypothetical protein VEN81_17045 [Planctomycetota bacterium]|nr:hypothetical protein [Planctomycetota bacterium]
MSVLTAIELGARTLTAVQVRVTGETAEIVKSGTAALDAVDAASAGKALQKCGISATRAILLVQRGQALLRDLELPESPPDQLVSMVRFQVEKEIPLPIDQIRYSYIETGRSQGKVRVQVVAVPREVLDPAIAAIEGAGVKVTNLYVTSFGLLSLARKDELVALVEVSGEEAEILVADQGSMPLSRTASMAEGFDLERVVQEVNRTLLSFSAKSSAREIKKVILAGEGPQASELAQSLRQRLSREVVCVGPGDLETAAAVGICRSVSLGLAIPDLLNPPTFVKKFRLTRLHRAVALAVIIVGLLVAWSQSAISSKTKELDGKRAELKILEPRAAEILQLSRQTALAHQWYGERNLWIEVLKAFQQNINTDNLWIRVASFDESGVIRLQGKARDDQQVFDLAKALKKTGVFQDIIPDHFTNSTDKGEYRKDFILTAHQAGYDAKKRRTP